MKKATKIISLVIATLMAVSILGGCGSEKIARERGEYTYWATMDYAAQATIQRYDEMMMYQELEKMTGIKINFLHPVAGSTGSEAFQILLTSTEIPDMVEYNWRSYPGGADAAINNKVIISLNKYLKDYAPNYYDYMEGEKNKAHGGLYKAQSVTQNGNYYGFSNLCVGTYRTFSGLYVRKDLLEKWGLDIPTTIDDWDNLFATAKANGVKYPLTGEESLFSISAADIFNGAWNVSKDFHMEDRKVVFSMDKPEYKEYVKTMASWMKKGYIDPDYMVNTAEEIQAAITTGESIASYGFVGSGLGKLLPAMENSTTIPDFDLVACPYPVLKEGDVAWFVSIAAESNDPTIAITTSCGAKDEERYKEAISWCDTLYSEEGKVLKSFGVEGKTFTKTEKSEIGEDGEKYKYTYTDLILDKAEQEKIGAHSVESALYHYMRPANAPGLNQHSDYLEGFYPYEAQKNAMVVWNQNTEIAKDYMLPPYTMTDKETARVNEITAKSLDTLNAAISNIILGKADIRTYDAAVAKAKKDGYDELREIYQSALDRYYKTIEE